MADPTDLILASGIIITTTTVVRNVKEKKAIGKSFEPIVFGFLLIIALLIISLFAPGLAKGLAILGLVGAFATNGPAIFSLVKDL